MGMLHTLCMYKLTVPRWLAGWLVFAWCIYIILSFTKG